MLLFNSCCCKSEKQNKTKPSFWKLSDSSYIVILFFSYTKLKARLLVLNVIGALGRNEISELFHSLFCLTFVRETKRMIEFKASMARAGHRVSRLVHF